MSNNHLKRWLKEIILVVIGNFLIAYSVQSLVLPNNVLSGGVAGVAVALYPIFHINQELMIQVLVIAMFLIGWAVLGKEFAIKTALSSIVYPIFISLLSNVPAITDDLIIASLYTGVLGGIGIGLVFRVNASTGGMDIPPLILAKYTNIEVSKWILVIDGLTILLGLYSYGPERVLIGLISVFATSYMINRVMMLGAQESKSVQIISEHVEEIKAFIDEELDRGCTIIPCIGGYQGEARTMILLICDKSQYPLVNDRIHEIDPTAFMVVTDTMDVKGEGFSYAAKV